jgi:hypothetical protein
MNMFVVWLKATPVSQTLAAQAEWLWPLCESFHFVGLVLVIGCAGFFDLRLMGFMRHQISMTAAHGFVKWAKVGFGISLCTGLIFFVSEPQQYVVKSAWWAKVAFLGVAGLNAMIFEKILSKQVDAADQSGIQPLAFKIVGFVSLLAWLAVLYFGRMLPYLEPGLDSNL